MMKKNQMLSLLLASLLAASALTVSCSDAPAEEPKEKNDPVTTPVETTAPVETEEAAILDAVPELDFEGRPFRVSVSKTFDYEFLAEKETGEVTNDAIFHRNQALEERFNITFTPIVTQAADDHTARNVEIRKAITAGEDAYDLIALYVYLSGSVVSTGSFLNWHDIPYVNFSAPWWAHDVNDAFTVNDKLYAAVSDACITAFQLSYVFLFNKQLAANYLDDDLYDVTENGKWTIDYLYNTSKDVYSDLNGSGKADIGDLFGFVGDNVTGCDAYLSSFGIPIVSKRDDGFDILLGSSAAVTAYEKIYQLYYENPGAYIVGTYDDKEPIFRDNQALFAQMRMYCLFRGLREMDVDYGILPYPKFDESQTEYHSNALDNYSVLSVPVTVSDTEFVGAITEAMSAESRRTVVPAFYDIALKGKYTRDERSVKMLDYIMDGKLYDISTLFSSGFNRAYYFVRDLLSAKKQDYASEYAKKEKGFITKADKLYQTLIDLE